MPTHLPLSLLRPALLLPIFVACGGSLEDRSSALASAEHVQSFDLSDELHVLVWTNAQLRTTPEESAFVQAFDYEDAEREERHGQLYVARLLEVRGDWLKVSTGPISWLSDYRPLHCIGNGIVDTSLALELWVHEDDVAPVLTERWAASYPDGTMVELQAGVPVAEQITWLHGFLVPITPPAELVARWYLPAALPEVEPEPESRYVQIDPSTLTLGQATVPWEQPDSYYSDQPYARANAAGNLVQITTLGCGSAVFGFSGVVGEEAQTFVVGGTGANETVRARELTEGATLRWEDGSYAGNTTRTLVLPWEDGAGADCFTVPVGHEQRSTGYLNSRFELCASAEEIRAVEVPRYQVSEWASEE